MRGKKPLLMLFTLAGVAGLAACLDQSNVEPTAPETMLAQAPASQACRLQDLTRDARDYFPQPEVRDARDLVGAISDACAAGDFNAVESLSWNGLGMVEALVDAGRGGAPAVGASFVNGLVDCIENGCEPSADNDIDVLGALSATGLFGVRGDDQHWVLSREAVAFTDFDGRTNHARWGLEVTENWPVVTSTPQVLLYGAPLVTGGTPVQDVSFGDLQFDMNRFPVPPGHRYPDGSLQVGICFEQEITLPHLDGDENKPVLEPRMQREAVLLEAREPSFCTQAFPQVQSASLLGSLGSMVTRPLMALFVTDRKAPSLGGTPLEFSRFAPVAANVLGSLEFVTQPNAVNVEGQPIGEIRVRARSGGGTPMEKVEITLSIRANQGIPAGAVLSGDIVSDTDESQGIAVFPDDGGQPVSVGKPGGYLLCANGAMLGFTFPEVCSDQFHVRNAQGG